MDQAEIKANLADSQPLIDELRAAGLQVDRLTDLIYKVDDVRPYWPILEKWFRLARRDSTKSEIVRALIPEAKHMVPEFLAEMRRYPEMDSDYALQIGVALRYMAGRKYLDEMLAILSDQGLPQRFAMLRPVEKFIKPAEMTPIYIRLLGETDHPGWIWGLLERLGKTKSPEALPVARRYLDHEDSNIRMRANKVVARLERDLAAQATATELAGDTPGRRKGHE